MATKADFSPEEWQVLQWAVNDVIAYVSLSDRGFWDAFKEASSAAKVVAASRDQSASALVRDLATDLRSQRDKEVAGNPTDMAGEVTERLAEASALVASKAPDELAAFKGFLLDLAEAVAVAAKGIAGTEAQAIENVRAALS